MELYVLNDEFIRSETLDEFASIIWTERYTSAGDVELKVPGTPEMIAKLAPGTFLACEGTNEVMLLETQEIDEDGLLTVKGESLLGFLRHRVIRASFYETAPKIRDWWLSGLTAGQTISNIVLYHAIGGSFLDVAYIGGLDGPNEKIPNLTLGSTDGSGPTIDVLVPFGPIYDAIRDLADKHFMGMRLYLESADVDDYSLLFETYRGEDRTSLQSENPLVRLSPNEDSLGPTKEIHSIATYKNIAYAFPPGDDGNVGPGVASSGGTSAELIGFNRRTIMIFCEDVTDEKVGGTIEDLDNLLKAKAEEALANNNYIKVIDGEIIPHPDFVYGVHYGLGDLIELQGRSGEFQQVRVGEYIRSQDETGERAYPTVSIVNYEEVTSWLGSD